MDASQVLKQARTAAGISQDELASRSSVRQPNIAAYEAGRRIPSEAMLKRLLDALRVRPSVVLRARRDDVLRSMAEHGARNVRVFGSIARGNDTPDSDVDLLVAFDPGTTLFDQADLIEDLESILGRHVDVVSEGGLHGRHQKVLAEAIAL